MDYTREDFLTGTAPYEDVYSYSKNFFQHEQQLALMSDYASTLKIRNFKKMYLEYVKSLRQAANTYYIGNLTAFEGQPIELNAGDWEADEDGVVNRQGAFECVACVHPILPAERLVNIDTGIEKLKIAFRKSRQWRYVIADKKTLASTQSIISLADMGIAVNSENAKHLVKYLHDVENLNYDVIPEKHSVSRLGWIEDEGFSPYVEELLFDGDANYKSFFESVSSRGKKDVWFKMAKKSRQDSVTSRIILAASFASVLVKPLGCLPFFVHLWGGTEVGKTVALMLAGSVWADPSVGRFIHTFNSTMVGREKSAAFVNSLPLILDELQIVRDNRREFDRDIYALAEGAGRTRGNKGGGIDKTPTWANCILTSGEMPITNARSGGGAVNRILEIECKDKIFEDAREIADIVRKNYGFAGREFVEKLQEEGNIEMAQNIYKGAYKHLSEKDTTEKQSMSAALVITADQLITDWLFRDGQALTIDEVSAFLQTRATVDQNARGYRYVCDWVSQNINKFNNHAEQGDIYGVLELDRNNDDNNWAYIISSVFHRVAEDGGYSSAALLSWLKQKGLILIRGRRNTRGKRINGILTECVCLKLNDPDKGEEDEDDGLPF